MVVEGAAATTFERPAGLRSRVVPCTERESDGSQGIDLEAGGRNREQDAPGSQSERAPAVPRASMFGTCACRGIRRE